MKKYVYLLLDEEGKVYFVYDDEKLAKKLLKPLSDEVNKELVIKKTLLNPTLNGRRS